MAKKVRKARATHRITREMKTTRKRTNKGFLITLIIIVVLLAAGLYYQFSYENCNDSKQCFVNAMYNCDKAVYHTNEWYYKVKGMSRGKCAVYVKNIKFNEANVNVVTSIEGKSMLCLLGKDRGTYMPEEKLDKCHGLLKEALQDAVIKQLQLYIVQNIKNVGEGSA